MSFEFTQQDVEQFIKSVVAHRSFNTQKFLYTIHDLKSGVGAAYLAIDFYRTQNVILPEPILAIENSLKKYVEQVTNLSKHHLQTEEEIKHTASTWYETYEQLQTAMSLGNIDEVNVLSSSLSLFTYVQNSMIGNHKSQEFHILSKDLRKFFPPDIEYHSDLENIITSVDFMPVFTQLVANSLYHSQTENLSISIRGRLFKDFQIVYTDNGIGIPTENLELIFEKGFTTRADKKNHGLGLHEAKQYMNKYEGTIEALPYEKGANFHIVIPKNLVIPLAELDNYLEANHC